MTPTLCSVVLFVACINVIAGNGLATLHNDDEEENNMINTERKLVHRSRDWVKVTQAPTAVVRADLGARLELECEVMGSPPPQVTWVKGSRSHMQNDEFSTNRVASSLSTGTGLAKTKSRLVIDCLMPHTEGLYTCLATAGTKSALASPSMVFIQGNLVNNLTALLVACPGSNNHGDSIDNELSLNGNIVTSRPSGRVPRITQWRPVVMETMGNDVTLPCRATGYPEPTVDWLFGDEMLLVENEPRLKVSPSGDLLIKKLRWTDMGGYTCVASNSRGRDSVESFLYPLLNESS